MHMRTGTTECDVTPQKMSYLQRGGTGCSNTFELGHGCENFGEEAFTSSPSLLDIYIHTVLFIFLFPLKICVQNKILEFNQAKNTMHYITKSFGSPALTHARTISNP